MPPFARVQSRNVLFGDSYVGVTNANHWATLQQNWDLLGVRHLTLLCLASSLKAKDLSTLIILLLTNVTGFLSLFRSPVSLAQLMEAAYLWIEPESGVGYYSEPGYRNLAMADFSLGRARAAEPACRQP